MQIPVNLDELAESKPVPVARYDLTILDFEQTESKEKKLPQFKISIGIDGFDQAPNVTHYMGIPSGKDEPKSAAFKALLMKRFFTMFSIPFDGGNFDPEDMRGAKGQAELTLSEPDDNGNIYNRLTLDRLKDEGATKATAGRTAPPPPKR